MAEESGTHVLELRRGKADTWFRALGMLPLIFFLAQGIHYWRLNELGHMLWMCNIGNLLLALGLFLNRPAMIRVAVLWLIPGLVIWLFYAVFQWGTNASSTLAHIGGLVVGLIALKRVGIDSMAWLYALFWYFAVQLVSRLITPVDFNVNASQKVYGSWDHTFNAYWKFWLVLSLLVAAGLWGIGALLQLVWPASIPGRAGFAPRHS